MELYNEKKWLNHMRTPQTITSDFIHLSESFSFMTMTTEVVNPTMTTEVVNPSFQRLHWHREMEINYISEGQGIYLINGVKYPFHKGDILLINAYDLHRAFETDNLTLDVFMFDPLFLDMEIRYAHHVLLPFREMGVRFTNLLSRQRAEHTHLVHILQNMKVSISRENHTYPSIVHQQLTQFLTWVNRHFSVSDAKLTPLKHRGMIILKEVIRTMEISLANQWTLKQLANLARLSPSRFSVLFQQAVGTSPLDYLIQLRLIHAAHLLESSNERVIDIADDCGFRNLSNFNRLFRQYYRMSPSELRQRRQLHKQ